MKNKWVINFGINEKQKKSSYTINGTTTVENHLVESINTQYTHDP